VPVKRSYAEHGDACATAHALELLGDRWTYPVLREVLLAPKRFGELQAAVRGVTPAVLTTRLRELEDVGLVRHVVLDPPASVPVYEATDWAKQLAPALDALGRWAQESPTRRVDGCGLTPDATAQSMRTMAPTRGLQPPVELQLVLHDARSDRAFAYDYRVAWDADGLVITRGRAASPAAVVHADSSTWARVLYEGAPLDSDAVVVDGDLAAVQRVVAQFATAAPGPEP
jgi:DNA-binding HxlR family transcriptional regulator